MDYRKRSRTLQDALDHHRLNVLLVTHLPNIRYLCGFTGSAGVLLVSPERTVFFTDGRYKEQARAEVKDGRIIIARKPPLQAAAEWLLRKRRNRVTKPTIGIEGEQLTVAAKTRLAKALGPDFRLREAPPLVEQARMVKDEEEIALLREAAELGAGLFERALQVIRPEVSEAEVAAEMELAARKAGAEAMSFSTIVAAGKRSALPHGRASQAVIQCGEFVVCDFGVILTGYCSDRTRTVYLGQPTSDARRVYDAVREAQQNAIAAVKPGISLAEVDGAARNVLKKKGLGRYFTHSTGHGLGLEVHEAPRVAAGQTDVLRPGMVITVEPGVYIPGKWGIRIEDVVVVTSRGCEVLAPATTELIAI